MIIETHLNLLGMRVKDRVTDIKGIVTSVCFDLYGCTQAAVYPGLDKDGNPRQSSWYDANRLEILSKKPVMKQPSFATGPQAEGDKGPADKPASSRF